MIKNFKYFLITYLLLITSCSNYKATDPLNNTDDNIYEIVSPIPDNVNNRYFIDSTFNETDIEFIIDEYFQQYNIYIIFLSDTKENIDKSTIIDTIKNIIKKDKYIKGVCLDLSRTDITEIKDSEFANLQNLAHIKLPSTIETIGANAFSGCLILKTVNFPNSITTIGTEAFKSCKSLYSADLSQTQLTIINQQTFYDCSTLTAVTLPETITTGIDGSAFSLCVSLRQINLPSQLNAIGDAAFYECKSLTSIKLNEKITKINNMAFYGCSALINIEYPGNNAGAITAGNDIFKESTIAKTLYLPNVKEEDSSWNNFLGYDWQNSGRIFFGQSIP